MSLWEAWESLARAGFRGKSCRMSGWSSGDLHSEDWGGSGDNISFYCVDGVS